MRPKHDPIYYPAHYTQGSIEVIQAIEGLGLTYAEGNVLKYLARYRHKGSPVADLKKARWYIDRIIEGLTRPAKAEKKAPAKKTPAPKNCLVPECNQAANMSGRYTGFCNGHGPTLSKEERAKYRADAKAVK